MKNKYINIQNKEILDITILDNLKDNSMLKNYPLLFEEWNFLENDKKNISILDISKGSNKKVWWIGKCGHEWYSTVKSRKNGSGCPYCKNRKVLIGYNDINTTNEKLANKMLNKEDRLKYTQFSNKRVDWKCAECNNIIKNKRISDVNIYGLYCNKCSDGISFPEKIMRELLIQLNIEFINEKSFTWSKNKRYDFYLPVSNSIIELHGGQHYSKGFETMGGKTLKEEKINDELKFDLAKNNDISNYIVIDCSQSEINFIKDSIINSELNKILDISKLDWIDIYNNAEKSISINCLKLWNSGMDSILEISKVLKIHKEMVRRYLKSWSELGECDFLDNDLRKNKILQIDDNNEVIKIWKSVNEISIYYEGNYNDRLDILKALNGITKKAYGYKWKYEKHNTSKNLGKRIVMLDENLKLINTYESITQACMINEFKSIAFISKCCKGHKVRAYGFKWMYEEDFSLLNSGML